jgi:hypothetical protein
MKYKFNCSDCDMEAVIEITDNPWDDDFNDCLCFACGSDSTEMNLIETTNDFCLHVYSNMI